MKTNRRPAELPGEDMPALRGPEKKINWYPGHMARAQRQLSEQLSRVDLAVELCDARVPQASRNPALQRLLSGKRRLRRAQAACSGEIERMAAKGVRKTVRILVVGIPNVGKSTFVNRIKGTAIAKTGDRPGVTRSNQWVRITPWLELLDTPGLLWPDLQDQAAARRLCWTGTISDQVTDTEQLAASLLEELMRLCPDRAAERFHIKNRDAQGLELLDEACRGRGWILPGGVLDEARGAALILDEYRAGKLGRLTLERAPRAAEEEA